MTLQYFDISILNKVPHETNEIRQVDSVFIKVGLGQFISAN